MSGSVHRESRPKADTRTRKLAGRGFYWRNTSWTYSVLYSVFTATSKTENNTFVLNKRCKMDFFFFHCCMSVFIPQSSVMCSSNNKGDGWMKCVYNNKAFYLQAAGCRLGHETLCCWPIACCLYSAHLERVEHERSYRSLLPVLHQPGLFNLLCRSVNYCRGTTDIIKCHDARCWEENARWSKLHRVKEPCRRSDNRGSLLLAGFLTWFRSLSSVPASSTYRSRSVSVSLLWRELALISK